jgi:hypothetical protein
MARFVCDIAGQFLTVCLRRQSLTRDDIREDEGRVVVIPIPLVDSLGQTEIETVVGKRRAVPADVNCREVHALRLCCREDNIPLLEIVRQGNERRSQDGFFLSLPDSRRCERRHVDVGNGYRAGESHARCTVEIQVNQLDRSAAIHSGWQSPISAVAAQSRVQFFTRLERRIE